MRRSRLGFAWVDEIDAPLGETAERYRLRLHGSAGSLELETTAPSATVTAAELASIGAGAVTVSVAMVGDRALSRWTSLSITLA